MQVAAYIVEIQFQAVLSIDFNQLNISKFFNVVSVEQSYGVWAFADFAIVLFSRAFSPPIV
jgi:hypothetical protein